MIDKSELVKVLDRVKARSPLVVQVTNFVSASFQAEVTLAIGAHPMMPVSEEEIEEIVSKADSLLINIGTIDEGRIRSILKAVRCAKAKGIPAVLDPVGCGVSSLRRELVFRLLDEGKFQIVKGNYGEISSIYGLSGLAKGVDSMPIESFKIKLENIAKELALKYNCVFVLTGEENVVSGAKNVFIVKGGEKIMAKVSGLGCALGSVMASFLTILEPLNAARFALELFSEVSRRAYSKGRGPGSFKGRFLDELYLLGEGLE